VTGRRNIIIAVGAIVLLAAVVGFYITLDVSPQIAYARLFIDVGLSIGLVAVILAFYREPVLSTDPIIQALKSLGAGKYKTRLNNESGPLAEISLSINELAKALESQHKKQEEIKRNLREELLPNVKLTKEVTSFDHSFHPELGPVLSAALEIPPKPESKPESTLEHKFHNAFIDSKPPQEPEPNIKNVVQDLGELYQRFVDAQHEIDVHQIEYAVFLKTIEQSRADLMKSHPCRDILFDIVKESNQVALQPRIIR